MSRHTPHMHHHKDSNNNYPSLRAPQDIAAHNKQHPLNLRDIKERRRAEYQRKMVAWTPVLSPLYSPQSLA